MHGKVDWRPVHQGGQAEPGVYTTLEQGQSHTGTQWQTSRQLLTQLHSASVKDRINGHWRELHIAVQWKQLPLCAHDSVPLYSQGWANCMTTTTDRGPRGVVTHFMVSHLRKMFVNKYVTVRLEHRNTRGVVQQANRCLPQSTILSVVRLALINNNQL